MCVSLRKILILCVFAVTSLINKEFENMENLLRTPDNIFCFYYRGRGKVNLFNTTSAVVTADRMNMSYWKMTPVHPTPALQWTNFQF